MTDDRPPDTQGHMERAVRSDIAKLNPDVVSRRSTLANAAVVLAYAIDSYSSQAKTAAELSAISRAISELRATMAGLAGGADDSGDDGAQLSIPEWQT